MLQAVTILVAMASRKTFLATKIAVKVAIWRPVFCDHVPSYSQEIPDILQGAFL